MFPPTQAQPAALFSQHFMMAAHAVQVEELTADDREAALDFLATRGAETVILAGWLREYGTERSRRGTFYGCWNAHGVLEGVALIGRATMFEARTSAALSAFAQLAARDPSVQLLFAESEALEKFWRAFGPLSGRETKLVCRELLYEKEAEAFAPAAGTSALRRATARELPEVVTAHADLITRETGTNPLDKDSAGFTERCRARIEEGKVWVLMEGRELIFKADVVAETPEAVYVEGLWVNPYCRRQGHGQRGWVALCRGLSAGGASVCGFVNEENRSARAFYEMIGCRASARFDKIFV